MKTKVSQSVRQLGCSASVCVLFSHCPMCCDEMADVQSDSGETVSFAAFVVAAAAAASSVR